MNILIFSQRFWPENFRINNIAQKLSKKNRILVVTEKPNYPGTKKIKTNYKSKSSYEKWQNIEIFRSLTIKRGKSSKLRLLLNYLNFIIFSPLVLFKKIHKKKIDIIFIYATSPIFQAIPAIIFGKIYKIPIVLWVQDIWPDVLKDLSIVKKKFILDFLNFFVNKIYINSDYVLVQSETFKKKISKNVKKKIEVLFNPETNKVKNNNTKNKKFVITYAGNIGKAQSFETLIYAVKKLKKHKLLIKIYGDGSEKQKLKNDIIKYKLSDTIKIFDSVSKEKIDIILSKSNAFLLMLGKGKGLSSTLPAKIQTYISHSKPIIVSSDGESFNFVKQNKIGFSSKAGNSYTLYKSILKAQNLKKKNLDIIKKRSIILFKKNFEINKWTKKLEQKLEMYAEDYKRRKLKSLK